MVTRMVGKGRLFVIVPTNCLESRTAAAIARFVKEPASRPEVLTAATPVKYIVKWCTY